MNARSRADTKYDPTAKKGGILQGDSAAVGLHMRVWTHSGCIGCHWSGVCTTLSGDAPDELALLVAGSYAPQWPEQRPHRLLQYQNAWASIFTGALLFNQIPYLLGH